MFNTRVDATYTRHRMLRKIRVKKHCDPGSEKPSMSFGLISDPIAILRTDGSKDKKVREKIYAQGKNTTVTMYSFHVCALFAHYTQRYWPFNL